MSQGSVTKTDCKTRLNIPEGQTRRPIISWQTTKQKTTQQQPTRIEKKPITTPTYGLLLLHHLWPHLLLLLLHHGVELLLLLLRAGHGPAGAHAHHPSAHLRSGLAHHSLARRPTGRSVHARAHLRATRTHGSHGPLLSHLLSHLLPHLLAHLLSHLRAHRLTHRLTHLLTHLLAHGSGLTPGPAHHWHALGSGTAHGPTVGAHHALTHRLLLLLGAHAAAEHAAPLLLGLLLASLRWVLLADEVVQHFARETEHCGACCVRSPAACGKSGAAPGRRRRDHDPMGPAGAAAAGAGALLGENGGKGCLAAVVRSTRSAAINMV